VMAVPGTGGPVGVVGLLSLLLHPVVAARNKAASTIRRIGDGGIR